MDKAEGSILLYYTYTHSLNIIMMNNYTNNNRDTFHNWERGGGGGFKIFVCAKKSTNE